MKIKIEKSSEQFFWYEKKIGETFNVRSYNEKWFEVLNGKCIGLRILKNDAKIIDENETIHVPPHFHSMQKKRKSTNNAILILLFMVFVTQLAMIGFISFYSLKETERDNKDERIHDQYMKILYYERVNHHILENAKNVRFPIIGFSKNKNKNKMENYQNNDIDREQMEHDIHNLPTPDQMKTFDEMVGFLKTCANCRVDCVHFFVLDLHSHLEKIQSNIDSIPLEKRKSHPECKRIKNRLTIVLKNYLDGNIQPTGTLNVDTTFSTYTK